MIVLKSLTTLADFSQRDIAKHMGTTIMSKITSASFRLPNKAEDKHDLFSNQLLSAYKEKVKTIQLS